MKSKSLSSIHIGYTDAAKEGTWVWTDGKPGSYQHWSRNQPDNYRNAQDCASLAIPRWNGFWDDDSCSKVQTYVCSRPGKPKKYKLVQLTGQRLGLNCITVQILFTVSKSCYFQHTPNYSSMCPSPKQIFSPQR